MEYSSPVSSEQNKDAGLFSSHLFAVQQVLITRDGSKVDATLKKLVEYAVSFLVVTGTLDLKGKGIETHNNDDLATL